MKRPYTSRRSYQKKARLSRENKSLRANTRNQVYAFKRFQFKVVQGGTDGVPYAGVVAWTLNDVPAASEFTTLFDNYKIAGVKYRWVINRNPDYGGAVVGGIPNPDYRGFNPRIMWVHDYDGGTTPSNFADLQQYPQMKEAYLSGDSPCTKWYWIKPARLAVEFEGAVNSAYRPQWKGFVDVASADVPHYGIRYYGDALSTNIQLRLECWYYLVMKNVR